MAIFHYKMQGILDVKEKLEDSAKQEFAAANARLNAEQEKLLAFQAQRAFYMQEGVELRKETIDILKIRQNKLAVLKMDDSIAAQKKEIAKAAKAVEVARVALQELMKDRKAHEKLKENAFEEFMKDEQAAESKEIDQLTSYTYGQRMMEEQ